tara:strand:+ start:174 stop:554 length:381 start_codon:yes stop_codon:yes gene_type:complete
MEIRGLNGMKLHHTKYKKNYINYILESLEWDGSVSEDMPEQDRIAYLSDRFNDENGYMVDRVGKQKAIAEWLRGLPLSIPCYYNEVIDLAVEMRSIDPNPSEQTRELVWNRYYDFMAHVLLPVIKD